MTIPAWAVPGRKVVCVNPTPNGKVCAQLEKGKIYTIERAETFTWADGYQGCGLHVGGAIRQTTQGRIPWGSWRFRLLITQEEDMLTFRSFLNTVPSNLTLETT